MELTGRLTTNPPAQGSIGRLTTNPPAQGSIGRLTTNPPAQGGIGRLTTRVRASVAGGAVAGELDGTTVRIALRAEVLRDRMTLARHLEALGRALYAARTRAFLDAVGARAEVAALGWRAEEYVRRRAAIVACGRSADGTVLARVEGMRRWTVEVAPAACVCVPAAEAAVQEAAEALLRDHARQIRALKRTIWQSGCTAVSNPALRR